jgi:hypothetical protein
MGMLHRSFTGLIAAAGLVSASQMPEFAQQYRQRLGGAVEELRVVVQDFDRDAQNSKMTRDEAIESLKRSAEQFPRDRGNSMERTVSRFENLTEQQARMESASPLTQAAYLFANPDRKLVSETWQVFEPAVPLNAPGAIWGGLGLLLAGLLARLPVGAARRMRRRRNGGGPSDAKGRQTLQTHGVLVDDSDPGRADFKAEGVAMDQQASARPHADKGHASLLDTPPQRRQRILGEVDAKGTIIRNG